MAFVDDEHIDVLQNIEFGLKQEYERHPDLTDAVCVFALENARVAVRQQFGMNKSQKVTKHPLAAGIIEWCVQVANERIGKINDLTLAEYLARLEKVKRSVARHSDGGQRGYYEFIRNFM